MLTTLGLGGAPLGNLYAPLSDETALALVRHAFDRASGISTRRRTTATVSPSTGWGARCANGRAKAVLSTKVGRLLDPNPAAPRDQHGYVAVLPFVQRWDYSREGTLRSLEHSLQRLGLARVDYAYIHDVARDAQGDAQSQRFREALDGAVPVLAELKAAGTIGGYGLGVNDWQVCVDALAYADLDLLMLAGRYTLLDQSALPTLWPRCVARNIRVLVGGPFNSGILATGGGRAAASSISTMRRRRPRSSRVSRRSRRRRAPPCLATRARRLRMADAVAGRDLPTSRSKISRRSRAERESGQACSCRRRLRSPRPASCSRLPARAAAACVPSSAGSTSQEAKRRPCSRSSLASRC